MEILIPRELSSSNMRLISSKFEANTDSVISSAIFAGHIFFSLMMWQRFAAKLALNICMAEMLIDMLRFSCPVSLREFRKSIAFRIIFSPTGKISFVFSAIGMNSRGDISPSFLLLILASASNPQACPDLRSSMG